MMIKVWDYLREYEAHRDAFLGAIDGVIRSGRVILGERVTEFERKWAAYCGLSEPGAGVNNGTDALFLALKALGVGAGDEVITVANTAIPTVSAIVSTGASPRFVDIDPRTFLMDADQLEGAITPQTRVILPVHLYGQCVAMEKVLAVAARHQLAVLEDCAQSHGATRHGRMAGAFGDVAAFSFYPTKILGTFGDAGMVCSPSASIVEKVKSLRMYGNRGTYYAEEHGYNSRLDELHAAILLLKMQWLDDDIARRRAIAARYDAELADSGLKLPEVDDSNAHAFYLYVVRHAKRDVILRELQRHDIVLNISYPVPIHLMRGYEHVSGLGRGALPHTEAAAEEVFSLPMYPTLSDDEQSRVIEALREVLGRVAA